MDMNEFLRLAEKREYLKFKFGDKTQHFKAVI